MQDWLHNGNILMYSAHNGVKSVIAKRFIKALKIKLHKKMTANDSKSCHSYLNKLVNQYNNTNHHTVNKKPFNLDSSALTEKTETKLKASEF